MRPRIDLPSSSVPRRCTAYSAGDREESRLGAEGISRDKATGAPRAQAQINHQKRCRRQARLYFFSISPSFCCDCIEPYPVSFPLNLVPSAWVCSSISLITDSWVHKSINQVNQKIDQGIKETENQDAALDHGVVSCQDRINDQAAKAGPCETLFPSDTAPPSSRPNWRPTTVTMGTSAFLQGMLDDNDILPSVLLPVPWSHTPELSTSSIEDLVILRNERYHKCSQSHRRQNEMLPGAYSARTAANAG